MSEPTCNHVPTCRVSAPGDISRASVYCCARTPCQDAAKAWVAEVTGMEAEVVALPRKMGRRT